MVLACACVCTLRAVLRCVSCAHTCPCMLASADEVALPSCCSAPAGIQTDLVENYLKIVNVAAAPGKATVEWQSEVVKVLQVSSAGVLTVQRGQGGSTARAFPIGALVHMCGKHAHCLVHSDLKRGRFIKVDK